MLKNYLINLTPPFIFLCLRFIKRKLNIGTPIYAGFYLYLEDLPLIRSNPFEHPNWISYVRERALSRKAGVSNQDMHEMSLSLLASIIPASEQFQVIVDYGGGVGMYWPAINGQNKASTDIRFIVVDNAENCDLGRQIFGDQKIIYESDFLCIKNKYSKIKILNIASTLQYCIDYESVIAMLCSLRSEFIIISRHPAPDDISPVAYAVQNVISSSGFCGQIHVVLLSVERIIKLLATHGYVLIADYYDEVFSDKYWQYSKANVPSSFVRITEHSLIFQLQVTIKVDESIAPD